MEHIRDSNWLKEIPSAVGYYLAGFVDGEGSFNVSFRQRFDHTMQWQVVLTFNVSQRDRTMLTQLKRYLGCGRIQMRKDGLSMYVVSNPRAIFDRVLPFFRKFQFRSSTKKTNFSLFSRIAQMVESKQHLTREGLRRITVLREKLNQGHGRKRKWNQGDIEKSLQKNPQRLYARPRSFRKE